VAADYTHLVTQRDDLLGRRDDALAEATRARAAIARLNQQLADANESAAAAGTRWPTRETKAVQEEIRALHEELNRETLALNHANSDASAFNHEYRRIVSELASLGADPGALVLDRGAALLEPITAREYGELERVLHVLWQAIESDDLEPHHRIQIQMMYRTLFDDHRDTVAEVTKRHGLVGTMRSIALMSNQEGMRAALAWWKLGEILHGIDWHTIADMLPGGPT
jgi:hypothetical protein